VTALFLVSALSLTLAACDWPSPPVEGDDDASTDDGDEAGSGDAGFVPFDPPDMPSEDGGDDGDDDLACRPTFEATASVLDHAMCLVGVGDAAIPVAACGTSDSRLRPCDTAWIHHCDAELGGDVEACDGDDERMEGIVASVTYCSITSPMVRACDAAFTDACDAVDYTFIAMNADASEGACVPPVTADVKFCCADVDTNTAKGFGCIEVSTGVTCAGDTEILFCSGSFACENAASDDCSLDNGTGCRNCGCF
jgi:hypothetical protein